MATGKVDNLPETKTPTGELEALQRQLEDLRVEFAALEMDFADLRQFFIDYLMNERAALMSVAKFAESRAMTKAPK